MAVSMVLCCVTAAAFEADDPDIELTPEFDNEIFDDVGDYPVTFTIGFGTHMQSPDGTSARLVLYADEGCEIEGMDENAQRIYGYSSIASEKYVCKQSSNGGFYPNYGETVKLKPISEKTTLKASLTISDKDGSIIHTEETCVYILKREDVIVLSDEGFDDAQQKLDKPLYRVLLFMKTPLGTVIKIILAVLIVGAAYVMLHYKTIRQRIRSRKALREEKRARKEGNRYYG